MSSGKKSKNSPAVVRSKGRWLTVEDNYYVPSWKNESRDQLSGYISDGNLYAIVEDASRLLQTSGNVPPNRSDSIYLNPDTMKQCGITIATPILLVSSNKEVVNIVKPWPVLGIELDKVGCTKAIIHSTNSEHCLVCLYPLPIKDTLISLANTITLQSSRCGLALLKQSSFINLLLVKTNSVIVTEGTVLSIVYNGELYYYTVVSLTSNTILDITDQLSDSFSHMTVTSPNSHMTVTSPNSHMTVTSPNSHMTVTSPNRSLTPIKHNFSNCSTPQTTPNTSQTTPTIPADINDSILNDLTIGKITMTTKVLIENDTKQVIKTRLSDIGGLQRQIELLQKLVLLPFLSPNIITESGVHFPHGVLIHGPSGTGKTLLAEAIAGEVPCRCEIINGSDPINNLLKHVTALVDEESCCLVVINDIDCIDNMESTIVNILQLIQQPSCNCNMVVIATTNKIESISGRLRRPKMLELEIEVPAPDSGERRDILSILLKDIPNVLTGEDIEWIASSAHGYVGMDLQVVCCKAQHNAFLKQQQQQYSQLHDKDGRYQRILVGPDDINKAMAVTKPSAMREITVEVPKVLWGDIGGQEYIKLKLKESIELPLKHPEVFKRLGVEPPRGVLLYGPPGCSKTMIARALATESKLNFLSVKGPELFSKWVGDSERAVRQVFSRARAVAPSIIFFDEIDALATHRQGDGSKVGDRVLAQLLTEMNGLVSLNNVIIIAATNRPDILDKALLRPGRIDRLIYVPLPTPDTRRAILQIQFKRTPVDKDVDIDHIVKQTDNFSGAEIVALVQEAALAAMHENITIGSVAKRHFIEAFKLVHPRTDMKTIEFYEKYSRTQ